MLPDFYFFISDSSFFLLVLPELLQLILINGLLIYCIVLSSYFATASEAETIRQMRSHTQCADYMEPVLPTEPVIRLMTLALACCTWLYLNTDLPYTSVSGLIWDDLGRFMSLMLCLSAMAALTLGSHSLKRFSPYEFIFIIWLSLMGMFCLIKSYSFLAFYLSVELQSLSFYMLAAMRSRTEASAEAGLKYFILSAFSSAMLLLGMALIYGAIGSQCFGDISLCIDHFLTISTYAMTSLWVGLGCIYISLLFKLGVAPLHAWIADVYEGSHSAITAWFAITAKIAVITMLIRVCSIYTLMGLLITVAVTSLLVGSLSAMRQVKLKRLIAFSAVANGGWFILALTTGQWRLMIIHLIVYTLLSINLFSVLTLPLFRSHAHLQYGTRVFKHGETCDYAADQSTIKYISDFNQTYKTNPSLAFAITITMFSLAGIPPLAGFYSKYLIISALTQTEQYMVLVLALGAAVISAFYYIRVVKTIYFGIGTGQPGAMGAQWWFSFGLLPINAYITALTTGFLLLFFLKPEYCCIWLGLL